MTELKAEDLRVTTVYPSYTDLDGSVHEDRSIKGIRVEHLQTGIWAVSFIFREPHLNRERALEKLKVKFRMLEGKCRRS